MTATTGRRHYQPIADIFRRAYEAGLDPTTLDILACELAEFLKRANSGFSYPKWYGAIGIPIPPCHQEGNYT